MNAPTTSCCTPIACDLTVFTPAERRAHDALLAELKREALSREPLADGARLVFVVDEEQAARIARFAVLEARCCPFLRLELALGGDVLTLSVRGPADAVPLVRDVFGV